MNIYNRLPRTSGARNDMFGVRWPTSLAVLRDHDNNHKLIRVCLIVELINCESMQHRLDLLQALQGIIKFQ